MQFLRQGFDIGREPILEDLTNTFAFIRALLLVLRLKPSGLLSIGLPCTSFSFMSSSQHGRSPMCPMGFGLFPFNQTGNLVTARASLLILVASCRGVFWFLENPARSTCVWIPYFQRLLDIPVLQCRIVYWCGTQKQSNTIGKSSWNTGVLVFCTCCSTFTQLSLPQSQVNGPIWQLERKARAGPWKLAWAP